MRNARKCLVVGGVAIAYLLRIPEARAQDALQAFGAFLGKPVGGFLGAAAAPTIANAEGAANQVVANVDGRLNKDMANAGQIVSGVGNQLVAHVDKVGEAWLGQANGIIGATVAQVFVDTNKTVDRAAGDFGALESKTANDVKNVVKQLNQDVKSDLDHVNQILDSRIEQVDGVIKNAVSEADDDVKARIDQADDVVQKTLGTADVLASKQTLGIQGALLRVGTLLGAVAFAVAALTYLFDHLSDYLKGLDAFGESATGPRVRTRPMPTTGSNGDERAMLKQHLRFAGVMLSSLFVHVVFGAACFYGLYLLSQKFPAESETGAAKLTSTHEKALADSLIALDFTKVRYHAAELAILNPDGESQYRAVQRRAELIRAVLSRPGLLASEDGIRRIGTLIDEAAQAQIMPDAGTTESADVLAAGAYVRWQLARTRAEETVAIAMFVHAIDVDDALSDAEKKNDLSRFVLKSVAVRYVGLFCKRRPNAFTWPANVKPAHGIDETCAIPSAGATELPQFKSLADYDQAVLDLDGASDSAYLALLDAQANLDTASKSWKALPASASAEIKSAAEKAVADAKKARLDAANKIRDAWHTFDLKLQTDSELPTSAQMATFTLNDVPLTQAAWVIAQPDAVGAPGRIADIADKDVRAVVAPARMSWTRRYLGSLSAQGQLVAGHEISTRYAHDEDRTIAFESAYIAYRKAVTSGDATVADARLKAMAAASAMGLYGSGSPRLPLGATLVDAQKTPPSPDKVPNDGVRLQLL